jgi:hypothetical protein
LDTGERASLKLMPEGSADHLVVLPFVLQACQECVLGEDAAEFLLEVFAEMVLEILVEGDGIHLEDPASFYSGDSDRSGNACPLVLDSIGETEVVWLSSL